MALVYERYGPKPPSREALANKEALSAVFNKNAPRRRAWHIYLDIKKHAGNKKLTQFLSPQLQREWDRKYEKDKGDARRDPSNPHHFIT